MTLVGKTRIQVEAERLAAATTSARADRDRRLAACDWTQVADAPVDRAAWAVYRQALRDITQHPDWPNVDWPEAPK
jgi:hypothetical protein